MTPPHTTDVQVRPAEPDDANDVVAVHRAAVRELAASAYDDEVLEAWVAPLDPADYDLDPEDGRFLVAERPDRADAGVVGFGEVRFEPPEYVDADVDGEVRALYVAPEHARCGVGTALLSELHAVARDAGVDVLGALASVNAVPFYRSRGWEVVAERTHAFGGEVEAPAVELRAASSVARRAGP